GPDLREHRRDHGHGDESKKDDAADRYQEPVARLGLWWRRCLRNGVPTHAVNDRRYRRSYANRCVDLLPTTRIIDVGSAPTLASAYVDLVRRPVPDAGWADRLGPLPRPRSPDHAGDAGERGRLRVPFPPSVVRRGRQ